VVFTTVSAPPDTFGCASINSIERSIDRIKKINPDN
jgi:hypothetical protein